VLIAVKAEAEAILASAAYRWTADKKHAGVYRSEPQKITLAVCGIGKANTAFALGQIFNEADEFIMFGTSGGLGHETVGSLYFCTEFVEHDMSCVPLGVEPGITPFSGMASAVIDNHSPETAAKIQEICRAENLPLNTGRALSGDQFIHDKATALAKSRQFGGQLCDMESAAAAKICMLSGKPFCAVRYITDNADYNASVSWQENVRISAGYFDRILRKL
jgi:nucleoside phosphorylase